LGSPAWEHGPIREPAGARMEGVPMTDLSTTPQRQEGAIAAEEPTLAEQVEAALAQDPALASEARNVTVTSRNGRVVLRGSVQTLAEKQRIEARAGEIVLPENVENEIEVTNNR
jgi:osmotically-inducible protein OsmY